MLEEFENSSLFSKITKEQLSGKMDRLYYLDKDAFSLLYSVIEVTLVYFPFEFKKIVVNNALTQSQLWPRYKKEVENWCIDVFKSSSTLKDLEQMSEPYLIEKLSLNPSPGFIFGIAAHFETI